MKQGYSKRVLMAALYTAKKKRLEALEKQQKKAEQEKERTA